MKKQLLPILLLTQLAGAIDNAHFYRATNLFQEPRFERSYLTSFDVAVAAGSTRKGRNFNGDTVPLLDTYGTHNMIELGIGVPHKNKTTPEDFTLIELSRTPGRDVPDPCSCYPKYQFGHFSIYGDFSIIEANIFYTQNITHGFFTQFHIPIRQLKIDDICFKDLSPCNDVCPNKNTPIWQTFLCLFDKILKKYCLSKEPFSETGVGDASFLAGWTHNHQDTEFLDFVDLTIKFGLLSPTGKTRNEDKIFSLPLGYNGHWGVPISFDIAFGMYDWLTFGGHVDAIFFAHTSRNMRLKTAPFQSGIIKLAKGKVDVERGSLWNAGAYIKADHLARGLSLLFAYSFANQNSISIQTCDPCFDNTIINCDEMLQGWKMHNLHFWGEYDFTKENSQYGTRLAVFYNLQVKGKRVFKTNTAGGSIGLDINWNF